MRLYSIRDRISHVRPRLIVVQQTSLSLCLSVSLYLSLFVSLCLSVSLSLSLSVSLYLSLSLCLLCLSLSVSLFVSLSLSLSLIVSDFRYANIKLFLPIPMPFITPFQRACLLVCALFQIVRGFNHDVPQTPAQSWVSCKLQPRSRHSPPRRNLFIYLFIYSFIAKRIVYMWYISNIKRSQNKWVWLNERLQTAQKERISLTAGLNCSS